MSRMMTRTSSVPAGAMRSSKTRARPSTGTEHSPTCGVLVVSVRSINSMVTVTIFWRGCRDAAFQMSSIVPSIKPKQIFSKCNLQSRMNVAEMRANSLKLVFGRGARCGRQTGGRRVRLDAVAVRRCRLGSRNRLGTVYFLTCQFIDTCRQIVNFIARHKGSGMLRYGPECTRIHARNRVLRRNGSRAPNPSIEYRGTVSHRSPCSATTTQRERA